MLLYFIDRVREGCSIPRDGGRLEFSSCTTFPAEEASDITTLGFLSGTPTLALRTSCFALSLQKCIIYETDF